MLSAREGQRITQAKLFRQRSQSEQQSDKTASETDKNVEPGGSEGKGENNGGYHLFDCEDGTEVIFKADTPEGEEYLGTQEMTVATSEAAEFKKRAEKAELIVIAFP